jgi:hypothetical protein
MTALLLRKRAAPVSATRVCPPRLRAAVPGHLRAPRLPAAVPGQRFPGSGSPGSGSPGSGSPGSAAVPGQLRAPE